ncbi:MULTISPECIES: dihydroneopterin aldolase [unclassified Saccharicrinis]|uniref:dihydroneopterin aldolase n=1 Tax=unclassified Saccharicrinis TaxID=2646859 RepID=UPI003D338FF7
MGTLKIKNLLVRSNVGFEPHLQDYQQDLLVTITVRYNSVLEEGSDDPSDAIDLKRMVKEIMGRAESGHFNLIEAFARMVLNTVLEETKVDSAEIEVKKVKYMQFSGELSFSLSGSNR